MFPRMTNFAWRVCQSALALPLLILLAGPPAIAQPISEVHIVRKLELQQRVLEIAHMLQKDPRYNRGKTPEQVKDGVEFVTGNVLFVLGHETAHALISVFEIPVIGREEDGADALATIVALKMGISFADRVVINAARGWFLSDRRDRRMGIRTPFYDEHGMDLQRAYHIVCLLVGGAPEKFTSLADEVKLPKERQKLPKERQDTCRFDHSNASWSWEQALKPHMRKPEDPKTKIEVSYAPTVEYASLAALGQKLRILESVAEWLSEDFVWKKPISLEAQECGGPNARWLPTMKKIVLCYEIIREFIQLHRNFGHLALVPGTIRMSENKKIVMVPGPNAGKNGAGKSFRAARARR
jgi:hypothetical protein